MSSWFQDILAHARSLWEGLDARSIIVFVGEKLAEGLLQAASVVLLGWLAELSAQNRGAWTEVIRGFGIKELTTVRQRCYGCTRAL
jgi:hypothetical protein